MNPMLTFRNNRLFYYTVAALFFSGILLLAFTGKASSFFLLNSYHSGWLDNFFICYTFAGNGLFVIGVMAIMLLMKRDTTSLGILISFITSGIAAQILKRLFTAPRPRLFFGPDVYSYYIEGITHSGNNSFPSGHTATAFALATVLFLCLRKRDLQWVLLPAAFMVGYSRIYLAQHFLGDVIAGAAVGIGCGVLSVYIVKRITPAGFLFKKKEPQLSMARFL
jgi:membrane-associated phospholipid phosphatase